MKKVWKKGLPLVLSLALLMTAGCSVRESVSQKEQEDMEAEMALAEKDAMAAEEGYEEEAPGKEEGQKDSAEAHSCPRLILSTVYDSLYHEERGLVASLEYDRIALTEESASAYPELASALQEMSEETAESMTEEYEDHKDAALESEETGEDGYVMRFRNSFSVGRADEKAVSIRTHYESRTGGAHGFMFSSAENFDAVTGKHLVLSDISPDPQALLDRACENLKEWCSGKEIELQDPDSLRNTVGELYEMENLDWSLDPDGVSFFFAPYSLASYAAGELTARVLFSESPDLFEGDLCSLPESYGICLYERQGTWADLDGDGSPEEIVLATGRDEYDTITGLAVSIDGQEYEFDGYGYGLRAFLLHGAGAKTMLYVDLAGENDYHSLEIFDLSDGEAVLCESRQAGCSILYDDASNQAGTCLITDPASFVLAVRAGDISTYSMSRVCHMGEDGLPVPETDYFTVVNGGYQFTVLAPFRASTVDPGTEEILEKDVTIPKGEVLTLVRSNNGSWVELTGKDGTLYRVEIDSSDWPRTIDGKDIFEIFDGLIFAG